MKFKLLKFNFWDNQTLYLYVGKPKLDKEKQVLEAEILNIATIENDQARDNFLNHELVVRENKESCFLWFEKITLGNLPDLYNNLERAFVKMYKYRTGYEIPSFSKMAKKVTKQVSILISLEVEYSLYCDDYYSLSVDRISAIDKAGLGFIYE